MGWKAFLLATLVLCSCSASSSPAHSQRIEVGYRDSRGLDHTKMFTVEVRVGKDWTGQADGRTKKIAAQRAARGVYDRLREETPADAAAAAPEPLTGR